MSGWLVGRLKEIDAADVTARSPLALLGLCCCCCVGTATQGRSRPVLSLVGERRCAVFSCVYVLSMYLYVSWVCVSVGDGKEKKRER